jgi:hypothetical protein
MGEMKPPGSFGKGRIMDGIEDLDVGLLKDAAVGYLPSQMRGDPQWGLPLPAALTSEY